MNALARQVVEKDVRDRSVVVTAGHMLWAKEALIERRDTHLDSLVEKLREPRVRRVLEPILAGDLLLGDRIHDDAAYVEDLGLVSRRRGGHLEIANPIYREVIPRSLAYGAQLTIPYETAWYVCEDGRLDVESLLEAFVGFWKQHGEALMGVQPYHEVAPHLVLKAFLQRIVNGGGRLDREYAVGRGRMDLCIRWPHEGCEQLAALELKVWRPGRPDPLREGLEQLAGYLEKLGLEEGVLVIFDRRPEAGSAEERSGMEKLLHEGRRITLLRL